MPDSVSAGQTAADLRTLVTRRVGLKRRVAFLGSDRSMVQALEGNGCTVLVDPDTLEALTAFQPDVVVAFDGFLRSDGAAALRALSAATQAELVLSFANAASASALVGALVGHTPHAAFGEPDVRRWLSAAGYVVKSRDVVVTGAAPIELSVETEVALRQTFEQLNPDAAVDRFLVVASRGAVATQSDRTPGLVSVVAVGDSLEAFRGTVASLANQQRRPLELLVVSPLSHAVLDELVAKARLRSGLTVVTLADRRGDGAALVNAGVELAQGQYVAFAEAGDLFDPLHLTELVKRLEAQACAFAVSGLSKADQPATFSLAAWLEAGWVTRSTWLVDRARLGRFPLTFAEGLNEHDALAFCRLALLFEPALTGRATVEKATLGQGDTAAVLAATQGRTLRGLTSLGRLLETPALDVALKRQLEAVDPRLSSAFESGKSAVERVRRAWLGAKKAAKDEG